MSINLQVASNTVLKPSIVVFGVGGAGCNAVNNMIQANLEGAKFVVANTDAQALHLSNADYKVQLGASITKGLGAGASPDIGKAAAEESMEEIERILEESNMVFITAGMGGGTGTGAAPVIAKLAREKGILTVGVVTKPFHFEGVHRMRLADSGLTELQRYVDTLIVIPNQNLFKIANAKTTFADAFKMADDVLHAGVRGITDLMIMPGLINLDFADIRAVMREMGKAMMGTGEAQGENRAIIAAEAAISNPLLDNCSMKGAKGVLINITGGMDMTLFEVDEAANRIREEVDPEANIIFGSAFNKDLDGIIRVSVVATGIDHHQHETPKAPLYQPSAIQQMQQLYKTDNKPIGDVKKPLVQNVEADVPQIKKEDKYPGVFFTPKALDPTKADNQFVEPVIEEKTEIAKEVKKEEVSKPAEKESFSLFGRLSGLNKAAEKKEKNEEDDIYTLVSESDDSEMINDEMLSIPAYQRRK